jgi:hypothetical protein
MSKRAAASDRTFDEPDFDSAPAEDAIRENRLLTDAAFRHFAALAAAYSGHGLPGADDPGAVEDDVACLRQVVTQLLAHREDMLVRRRKAAALELVTLLTPIYKAHLKRKSETRAHLEGHVRAVIDARGIEVPEWWIGVLAPEREEFRWRPPKHKQGVVATARYLVCERLFKFSASSLSPSKRPLSLDLHLFRSMFGVAPSLAMVRAHARRVLDSAPPADHPEHAYVAADVHLDNHMRRCLQSLPSIMRAAADDMSGHPPSLADIPVLKRFAKTHPAVREKLAAHFLKGVAKRGHDADELIAMLADGRMSDQVARLLRIFDGELESLAPTPQP